jgi:hypothetical protein
LRNNTYDRLNFVHLNQKISNIQLLLNIFSCFLEFILSFANEAIEVSELIYTELICVKENINNVSIHIAHTEHISYKSCNHQQNFW